MHFSNWEPTAHALMELDCAAITEPSAGVFAFSSSENSAMPFCKYADVFAKFEFVLDVS